MPSALAVLAESGRVVRAVKALGLVGGSRMGYWQIKVLGAIYLAGGLLIIAHLLTHPALLRRRLRAIVGERDARQRLIVALAVLCIGAQFIVATTDLRSGWSEVPVPIVLLGDLLVAAGLALIWLVFRANPYAAATVQVERDQPVISSGPYALVRHPLYSAGLLLFLGMPLALASWWALTLFIPLLALIVWRLTAEEAYLAAHLPGYREYQARVPHRLVPRVW
jgi:protein-S-isoprenylcysteine O-methyltransferase Ste14